MIKKDKEKAAKKIITVTSLFIYFFGSFGNAVFAQTNSSTQQKFRSIQYAYNYISTLDSQSKFEFLNSSTTVCTTNGESILNSDNKTAYKFLCFVNNIQGINLQLSVSILNVAPNDLTFVGYYASNANGTIFDGSGKDNSLKFTILNQSRTVFSFLVLSKTIPEIDVNSNQGKIIFVSNASDFAAFIQSLHTQETAQFLLQAFQEINGVPGAFTYLTTNITTSDSSVQFLLSSLQPDEIFNIASGQTLTKTNSTTYSLSYDSATNQIVASSAGQIVGTAYVQISIIPIVLSAENELNLNSTSTLSLAAVTTSSTISNFNESIPNAINSNLTITGQLTLPSFNSIGDSLSGILGGSKKIVLIFSKQTGGKYSFTNGLQGASYDTPGSITFDNFDSLMKSIAVQSAADPSVFSNQPAERAFVIVLDPKGTVYVVDTSAFPDVTRDFGGVRGVNPMDALKKIQTSSGDIDLSNGKGRSVGIVMSNEWTSIPDFSDLDGLKANYEIGQFGSGTIAFGKTADDGSYRILVTDQQGLNSLADLADHSSNSYLQFDSSGKLIGYSSSHVSFVSASDFEKNIIPKMQNEIQQKSAASLQGSQAGTNPTESNVNPSAAPHVSSSLQQAQITGAVLDSEAAVVGAGVGVSPGTSVASVHALSDGKSFFAINIEPNNIIAVPNEDGVTMSDVRLFSPGDLSGSVKQGDFFTSVDGTQQYRVIEVVNDINKNIVIVPSDLKPVPQPAVSATTESSFLVRGVEMISNKASVFWQELNKYYQKVNTKITGGEAQATVTSNDGSTQPVSLSAQNDITAAAQQTSGATIETSTDLTTGKSGINIGFSSDVSSSPQKLFEIAGDGETFLKLTIGTKEISFMRASDATVRRITADGGNVIENRVGPTSDILASVKTYLDGGATVSFDLFKAVLLDSMDIGGTITVTEGKLQLTYTKTGDNAYQRVTVDTSNPQSEPSIVNFNRDETSLGLIKYSQELGNQISIKGINAARYAITIAQDGALVYSDYKTGVEYFKSGTQTRKVMTPIDENGVQAGAPEEQLLSMDKAVSEITANRLTNGLPTTMESDLNIGDSPIPKTTSALGLIMDVAVVSSFGLQIAQLVAGQYPLGLDTPQQAHNLAALSVTAAFSGLAISELSGVAAGTTAVTEVVGVSALIDPFALAALAGSQVLIAAAPYAEANYGLTGAPWSGPGGQNLLTQAFTSIVIGFDPNANLLGNPVVGMMYKSAFNRYAQQYGSNPVNNPKLAQSALGYVQNVMLDYGDLQLNAVLRAPSPSVAWSAAETFSQTSGVSADVIIGSNILSLQNQITSDQTQLAVATTKISQALPQNPKSVYVQSVNAQQISGAQNTLTSDQNSLNTLIKAADQRGLKYGIGVLPGGSAVGLVEYNSNEGTFTGVNLESGSRVQYSDVSGTGFLMDVKLPQGILYTDSKGDFFEAQGESLDNGKFSMPQVGGTYIAADGIHRIIASSVSATTGASDVVDTVTDSSGNFKSATVIGTRPNAQIIGNPSPGNTVSVNSGGTVTNYVSNRFAAIPDVANENLNSFEVQVGSDGKPTSVSTNGILKEVQVSIGTDANGNPVSPETVHNLVPLNNGQYSGSVSTEINGVPTDVSLVVDGSNLLNPRIVSYSYSVTDSTQPGGGYTISYDAATNQQTTKYNDGTTLVVDFHGSTQTTTNADGTQVVRDLIPTTDGSIKPSPIGIQVGTVGPFGQTKVLLNVDPKSDYSIADIGDVIKNPDGSVTINKDFGASVSEFGGSDGSIFREVTASVDSGNGKYQYYECKGGKCQEVTADQYNADLQKSQQATAEAHAAADVAENVKLTSDLTVKNPAPGSVKAPENPNGVPGLKPKTNGPVAGGVSGVNDLFGSFSDLFSSIFNPPTNQQTTTGKSSQNQNSTLSSSVPVAILALIRNQNATQYISVPNSGNSLKPVAQFIS